MRRALSYLARREGSPLAQRPLRGTGGGWARLYCVGQGDHGLNAFSAPTSYKLPLRISQLASVSAREANFFSLYRILQATVLAALCFGAGGDAFIALTAPLVARATVIAYLLLAPLLWLAERKSSDNKEAIVRLGLLVDILVAGIMVAVSEGADSGIATLIVVTVACAALLFPLRSALLYASLAALVAMIATLSAYGTSADPLQWAEAGFFIATYVAVALLGQILRQQSVAARDLVEEQESGLARMSELNAHVIRRMRTGVLAVDRDNRLLLHNQAAVQLVGHALVDGTPLFDASPALTEKLRSWRDQGAGQPAPLSLVPEGAPVRPRFVRLTSGADDITLAFLDDTSLVSREAESLTLASLGRLAASIAHEIRNPLASISYASQLLDESETIDLADQRMVEIIRDQCQRLNGIVDNVLHLARRERSQPDMVDLGAWVSAHCERQQQNQPLVGSDQISLKLPREKIQVLVDPSQFDQVLGNLLQNALRYGRLPGEPARIVVAVGRDARGLPQMEVIDRGPGVPQKLIERVFEPFFTTHEHGTGLGLYLARQLCEANDSRLTYAPVAGGGGCFRIQFPETHALTSVTRDTGEMPALTLPSR